MSEDIETCRKRLIFRSGHRGLKEMDLLLGGFAQRHLGDFSMRELAMYDALLEENDPNVYAWITGREACPAEHDTPVMKLLKNFKLVE
jgi:antitoxin CptB